MNQQVSFDKCSPRVSDPPFLFNFVKDEVDALGDPHDTGIEQKNDEKLWQITAIMHVRSNFRTMRNVH